VGAVSKTLVEVCGQFCLYQTVCKNVDIGGVLFGVAMSEERIMYFVQLVCLLVMLACAIMLGGYFLFHPLEQVCSFDWGRGYVTCIGFFDVVNGLFDVVVGLCEL
jgi:hypothetical protein